MTILDNGTRNQYTATGGQTVFIYDFEIFESGDIVVYRNTTLLSFGTDYTLTGVGDDNGGTVVLTAGATAGHVYTIFRQTTPERITDYQQSGNFLAEEINNDLDRIWAVIQELETDQSRFLQTSEITQVPLPVTLEDSITGNYLRWKDANTVESVSLGTFSSANAAASTYDDSDSTVTAGSVQDALDETDSRLGFHRVADYAELIALDTTNMVDGQVVHITDSGIAGSGNIRKVVGHGFTSTSGVIVRIDDDTYWEREYGEKINIRWYSPAGDGTTNDASIIDLLNVTGNSIDLAGLSYAYTGSFSRVAKFYNGNIISSVNGTYEYTDNIITTDKTITVGAAGTFLRLDAALDYLKSQVILAQVQLSILDKYSTKSASDPMALDQYLFDHPQSYNVELVGPAMAGAVPSNSDMTGTESTDETFCLGRYNAAIYLHGTGSSGSYGLACPNGLARIKDLMVFSATRYSIDLGFNGSHFASDKTRGCIFENYTGFGGVWGIIGKDAHLAFNTDSFFAYQFEGGPIDSLGCVIRADAATMNLYTISGVQPSTGPKYGIFADERSMVYLPFNNVELLQIQGSFLHGIFADNGSFVSGVDVEFTGVTQPLTASKAGAYIKITNPVISDADPTNTASVSGASQGGYGNNIYQGSLICAGLDATVDIHNGTMDNCIATRGLTAAGGRIFVATGDIAVDDCRFTVAFANFDAAGTSQINATLTNPKSGSLDQCLATNQSSVRVGTSSGLSFGPALNTTTNGNLFSSSA
jgi:hypothetical protein